VSKLNFNSFDIVVLITDKNATIVRISMISWIYMYSSFTVFASRLPVSVDAGSHTIYTREMKIRNKNFDM
jgi:hypothetical protein